MLYLVALIVPPLAVLLCGKPFQAILNCFLCLLFLVPGIIHALLVANSYYAQCQTNQLIEYQRQLAQWQMRESKRNG